MLMVAVNWGTNNGTSENFSPSSVGLTLFAISSFLGPVSGDSILLLLSEYSLKKEEQNLREMVHLWFLFGWDRH